MQPVSEWQCDKIRLVRKNADFFTLTVAMATPLEESKKEVQIGHTQTNTYNLVQDRENRSSES